MGVSLFFLAGKNRRPISLSVCKAWLCKDKGILPVHLSQIMEFCLCTLQVHSPDWMLISRIPSTVIFVLKCFLTIFCPTLLALSSGKKKKKKKVSESKYMRINNFISWLSFLFFGLTTKNSVPSLWPVRRKTNWSNLSLCTLLEVCQCLHNTVWFYRIHGVLL